MDAALDRLMVKPRVWNDARVPALIAELGGTIINTGSKAIGWLKVRIDHTRAADVYEAFAAHPEIADVWFPGTVKPQTITAYHAASTDPLLDSQSALKRMNVYHAWKYTRGAGALVGICDTGFYYPNLQNGQPNIMLSGRNVHRWNSYYNSDTYTDEWGGAWDVVTEAWPSNLSESHGTATCSTLFGSGNKTSGPSGVAPEISDIHLMRLEPIPAEGYADDSDICTGIVLSVQKWGVRLLSISYGDISNCATLTLSMVPQYMIDAFNYATANGCLVGLAAANDGWGEGWYQFPGSYSYMAGHLRIGATTYEQLDRPAQYSDGGSTVNACAQGQTNWAPCGAYINTSMNGFTRAPDGYASPLPDGANVSAGVINVPWVAFNGTSCATPLVMGVCALIHSVNPSLTGLQVRDILFATGDRGQHPEFVSFFPNAIVPNAGKGVLKALTTLPVNAGRVWPYVGFYGAGVKLAVTAGVAQTDLYGAVNLELDGFSTDPITSVQLWAGAKLIYSGPPRRMQDGNMLAVSAALFDGQPLRVVAFTANGSGEETYSDVAGHSTTASALAPVTSASGTGSALAFSAVSDNPAVTIYYRVNGGEWQRVVADEMSVLVTDPPGVVKAAPVTIVGGGTCSVDFYGVDALGHVEGGVDYANGR